MKSGFGALKVFVVAVVVVLVGFFCFVLIFCCFGFFLVRVFFIPGSATGFQGNVRQITALHCSSGPYTGFYCDYSFKRAFK